MIRIRLNRFFVCRLDFEIRSSASASGDCHDADMDVEQSCMPSTDTSETPKDKDPTRNTYSSTWSDYLRSHVNRVAHPIQKFAADRRRYLHALAREEHCYDQKNCSAPAGKPSNATVTF